MPEIKNDDVVKLYRDLLNHGYSKEQAQLFIGRCVKVVGAIINEAMKEEMTKRIYK